MAGTIFSEADILIFAPHPDDETLGCGWAILRAAQAGVRVHIAVLTNGDGFPLATATALRKDPDALAPADYLELGRRRQQEVLAAVAALGLTPGDVSFLAYPDFCLDQLYKALDDTVITQQFTQQSQTYGLAVQDYHTQVHGAPAPYNRHALLDDVAGLIRRISPARSMSPTRPTPISTTPPPSGSCATRRMPWGGRASCTPT